MLERLRQVLIFFRAHTAILETPLAVLGAAYGLGTWVHPDILLWALFGLLYHYAGYGMNSLLDWVNGYDKEDEYKQHHPLNTGTLTKDNGIALVFGSLVSLVGLGIYVGGQNAYAVGTVCIMLVVGSSYNFFGKLTSLKFIPIALVHTMVFTFPYFSYTSEITLELVLIVTAIFAHHVYQIAISGDIKDIAQDESSLLKDLGVNAEYDLFSGDGEGVTIEIPMKARIFASILVVIEVIPPALIVLSRVTPEIGLLRYTVAFIGFTVCLFFLIRMSAEIMRPGNYIREARIKYMSIRELAGYWFIAFAMVPLVGIELVLLIVGLSAIYLVSTSRFMWGTNMTPSV